MERACSPNVGGGSSRWELESEGGLPLGRKRVREG